MRCASRQEYRLSWLRVFRDFPQPPVTSPPSVQQRLCKKLYGTQCVLLCRSMATGAAVTCGHMAQHDSSLTVQKFPEFGMPDSAVCCNLQTVSGPPLTAEARARSQSSLCEICGGQSDTGTDLWWTQRQWDRFVVNTAALGQICGEHSGTGRDWWW